MRLAVVLYYSKLNRHGFNALAGALQIQPDLSELPVVFPTDERRLFGSINEALSQNQLPLVGISFMTAQHGEIEQLMRRLLHQFQTHALFVAGGPQPTADPTGTLRLGFDFVVVGEGEASFVDLVRNVMQGGDRSSLHGIAYRDASGNACLSATRTQVDLNAFPPWSERHVKIGPIEITRGCPFACAFCQTSHLFGGRPRHRSLEQLKHYLEVMARREMWDVRFVTPDAFAYGSPDGRRLNLPMLSELLEMMRRVMGRRGRVFFGSFPSEVRPEHVTPESARLVRQYADNDNLVIGAQSGSERMLKHCHRGHSVEDVQRAVETTLSAGLKPKVDFILGLPGESDEDVAATLTVMRQLVARGAKIHAHTFMPLPQSKFEAEKPAEISPGLRQLLRDLIPHGGVYGSWEAQQILGQR